MSIDELICYFGIIKFYNAFKFLSSLYDSRILINTSIEIRSNLVPLILAHEHLITVSSQDGIFSNEIGFAYL